MPLYEFVCLDCGHRFTKLSRLATSSTEEAPPACPQCCSANTKRAISSFAVGGPGGVDVKEVAANEASAKRQASVTPKDQIDKWRAAKK
jgi:putative FmdB family regulatory protein